MVVGFNHNIMYKGVQFHVQTEDSGLANPNIVTLLYRGGTIHCSKKTSYADIIKVEQLELVVESIMKDQHKDMMRRLKSGEFDARLFPPASSIPSQNNPPVPPPKRSLDEVILDYLITGEEKQTPS